ncbi:MAG: hypothetical protein D6743_14880, partial [Calditrichaeota bacterium]
MLNRKVKFVVALVVCLSLVFVLLQSFSFRPNGEPSGLSRNGSWPTSRELSRKLWELRKVLVVYATGNSKAAGEYEKIASRLAEKTRWFRFMVAADTSVSEDELKSLPLILVGTPASNSVLHRIQRSFPFHFSEEGFSAPDLFTANKRDVVVVPMFPNPLQRSLPLAVITGKDDEAILAFWRDSERFYPGRAEFRVMRDGQRVVHGFFLADGKGSWKIDLDRSRNYTKLTKTPLETEHYRFIYHGATPDRAQLEAFARQQERRISDVLALLDPDGQVHLPKIAYHLYESAEDKGLITGNTDLSHVDPKRWAVHTIFAPELRGTDFFADAKLVIGKLLGQTASLLLQDGLAMHFSEGWGKYGYRYWAKRFDETDNVNPLAEMLDNEIYRKESYLFMRPLAGTLVDFLIARDGWSRFVSLYQHWPQQRNGLNLAELEKEWRSYLHRLKVDPRPAKTRVARVSGFQKGFCYAHEGYGIYNGYLSRQSQASLKKLRDLGTEWISLTPFGYLRDRHQPGYLRYSFGAGAENDESLICAVLAARKLGMHVMLKPHILLSGPHWGWPGDIEMKSEEAWQAFFKRYQSWIRHYALLAEMYDVDIFCVGVELLHATRGHDQAWRQIIRNVRKLYHGPLVYAANWWQEFDHISFWDELDYIGLNCYYPLSSKEHATPEDLRRGAQEVAEKVERVARRAGKPVLLTEIGFTSTERPWLTPHERRRGSPVDLQDQALCYEAVFEAFWQK